MARYKGKREIQKDEKTAAKNGSPQQERKAPAKAVPADLSVTHQEPLPVKKESDDKKTKGGFFKTGASKITLVALCATLAFVAGGAIAIGGWIRSSVKPPELGASSGDTQNNKENTTTAPTTEEDTPVDEFYPDDGYGGDMPTVSGDRKEGMYTFLLVGTDQDDGNTDTIMVVSYDTIDQEINIMSIPRDTMINESWDIKKINSVYARTGGSMEALAKRVRKLIGFQPDFYVKVELGMFVELVDLVGGVEFDVPQDMNYSDPYQDLYIDLKAGKQTLDGDKAMQLVRFRRYAEGDIKRVQVQQDFMKALIRECLSINNWGKVKSYIDLALENVQTDLDFGSVVWFAANVLGMDQASMLNMDDVYTCTIPGDYYASAWSRDTNGYQSYVTIYAGQTVKLVNERFNPYVQNVTTSMLDVMSILSNGDIASSVGLKDTAHNAIMAVQRGEAYYDASGKLVYGKPSTESESDPKPNEVQTEPADEPDAPAGGSETPASGSNAPPADTDKPADSTTETPDNNETTDTSENAPTDTPTETPGEAVSGDGAQDSGESNRPDNLQESEKSEETETGSASQESTETDGGAQGEEEATKIPDWLN